MDGHRRGPEARRPGGWLTARRAGVWLAIVLGVLSLATLLTAVPMTQPVAAAPAAPAQPPAPPVTGTVLDLALLDLRAQSWKPAPRLSPDHRGMQVVGLETWLAIDPGAWTTLSTFQSDGAIAVAATATPVRTVWVFSDKVVRCDGPGVEYTAGATGPAPCGREWEHTTAVAPMAMEVYIEYRVDWESSTGEKGTIDPLAGNSLGRFDLSVGEIQSVGTLGDDPHPDDPGIRQPDLGSRAACTIFMLSSGQCSDPQDPPVPSEPGTEGKKPPKCDVGTFLPWNWGSDTVECAKAGAGEVIDYVKEKATEIYALLPGPLKAVVDALAGCAEFGIDAVKNLWSSVETLGKAIADPQGFVTEQLDLLRSLKQALETDPEGFITEFLGEQVDLKLLQENKAKWIGKMGCEVAVALFSAGAGSSTRIGKIFSRIDDIKAWVKGKLHLPGGKDHIPGEGDPIPGEPDLPGDHTPDGHGPTCPLGGGKCGCNSFPSGTLVALADGSRVPIERIEPGDRVLTYDTVVAAWRSQPVLAQWSAVDHGSMGTVTVTGGGTITATDGHRFWVDSRGAWVDLADLRPGDLLLTPDGVTTVGAVEVHEPDPTVVWELDVAVDDDFVVTQVSTAGAATALVHNVDCTPDSVVQAELDRLKERDAKLPGRYGPVESVGSGVGPDGKLITTDPQYNLVGKGDKIGPGTTREAITALKNTVTTDGDFFVISDVDEYMAALSRAYPADNPLNPTMASTIRQYIVDNGGRLPVTDAAGGHPGGFPGSHAEILAANDLLNKGVDPSRLTVGSISTRADAIDFPACGNCDSILGRLGVNVITG